MWMNSRSGSPGAPCSRMKASNDPHSSRWVRSYSARKSAHSLGSSAGSPEKVGAHAGSLDLQRVAAHDPDVRRGAGQQGREADDVVLDDDVRLVAADDLLQLRLAVARAVDQLLEDRPDEGVELVDASACGTPARCRARSPSRTGRRPARAHPAPAVVAAAPGRPGPPRSPAARACPRHDASAAKTTRCPRLAQHVADADAVVRRPVGALGHEEKGQTARRHSVPSTMS